MLCLAPVEKTHIVISPSSVGEEDSLPLIIQVPQLHVCWDKERRKPNSEQSSMKRCITDAPPESRAGVITSARVAGGRGHVAGRSPFV